eukprot:123258-Hanusia_phi.AAC.7
MTKAVELRCSSSLTGEKVSGKLLFCCIRQTRTLDQARQPPTLTKRSCRARCLRADHCRRVEDETRKKIRLRSPFPLCFRRAVVIRWQGMDRSCDFKTFEG